MKPTLKKSLLASSIALALGAPPAHASLVTNVLGFGAMSTDSANFTFLDPYGYVAGGSNGQNMYWDGNAYNSSTDYMSPGSASNVIMSSATSILFSHAWTAHDIQVFMPGTYSFDTHTTSSDVESGTMNMVVGPGQLGMHMLFDWNGEYNIDIVNVWNLNSVFGAGIGSLEYPGCIGSSSATKVNCLYDGPNYGSAGQPNAANPWMLASTDPDGDGIMGVPMAAGGTFQFFNANFNANLTPVPVPAATWLFGSGMLGLYGAARRRVSRVRK